MVMVGDADAAALLRTEEMKALVNNPANAGKLLELIAPLFKNQMFSVCCGARGHISVYLPAVLMQDRNSEFRSAEGMSDLITQLFVLYIRGVEANSPNFLELAGRVKGALSRLVESSGLRKAPSKGRMSMQCKTMAMPGIPLSEVWVKESARPDSVHGLMQSTFTN
jgi:hypothetical protein